MATATTKRHSIDPDFWERWNGLSRDGRQTGEETFPPVPASMREAVLDRIDEWVRMKARVGKRAMLQRLRSECYHAEECFDRRGPTGYEPADALADRMLFGLLSVG